jgi:hypothetical protein
VICTYFKDKGRLSRDLWLTDLKWTAKNISPITVRGYHWWAVPAVERMRKGAPRLEALLWWITKHRADELAHRAGKRPRGSWRGKLVRWTMEPASFVIGLFVGEQDWKRLYEAPAQR